MKQLDERLAANNKITVVAASCIFLNALTSLKWTAADLSSADLPFSTFPYWGAKRLKDTELHIRLIHWTHSVSQNLFLLFALFFPGKLSAKTQFLGES